MTALLAVAGLAAGGLLLARPSDDAPDPGDGPHDDAPHDDTPYENTPADDAPAGPTLDASATLLFHDDFDGGLDRARWQTCHWWVDDGEGCTIATNDELQWYVPGNVDVADGVLELRAERRAVTGRTPEGAPVPFEYASGMVTTGRPTWELDDAPGFAFTYGRVEIRARVPGGEGLWPAFWLLPTTHDSLPEIDVLELFGSTDTAVFFLHWRDADGDRRSRGHEVRIDDLTTDWHVFGLDWGPGSLSWDIDGVEHWRVEGPEVPDEPMYLVANLAVGGVAVGPPDESTRFPARLLVDWVRVAAPAPG